MGSRYIEMGTEGRHTGSSFGWLPVLAVSFVAALAVLVAAGVLPLTISAGHDDGARADGPRVGQDTGVDPSTTQAGAETAPQSQGCKGLWAQELRVALAAERTLQEWRLHVDAMNDLVAGKITLAQAAALWDHSEQGALRRIERFQRLDAGLRRSPDRCESTDAPPFAGACARAAHAVQRTIAVARNAVRTWRLHIRDMDLLREGHINADEAKQMWHHLWHKGQEQTVRYDKSASDALAHDCS
jgi:hypothetical protein